MKKILVISQQAEEYVNREVYHLLGSSGHCIKICIPTPIRNFGNQIIVENENICVEKVEAWGSHPRIQFIKKIAKVFKKNEFDVVIIDNDVASIIVTQIIFNKKNRTKIFVNTFENFNKKYLKEAKKSFFKFRIKNLISFVSLAIIEKFNSNYVNLICVFSSESKEVVSAKFKNIDVHLIPLGISSAIFHETSKAEREEFKRENDIGDKVIIAYFGRIIREKGLEDFYELLRTHPNKDNFFVVMDDCFDVNNLYAEYIKKIFTKLMGPHLKIIEANHIEIANYVRNVDLIVCPSHQNTKFKEQYGRIIVEAKLSKTPVICSNSGAFPETHGDPNFIFKVGNMIDMHRAFDYAISASQNTIDALYVDAFNRQTTNVQSRILSSLL